MIVKNKFKKIQKINLKKNFLKTIKRNKKVTYLIFMYYNKHIVLFFVFLIEKYKKI